MCAGIQAHWCAFGLHSFLLFVDTFARFLARACAHPRRLASSSDSESVSAPVARPPDDLVPETVPEVPIHGTDSAPLDALLAWRAEIDTAKQACSAATADHNLAVLAKAATKANLNVAIAADNVATDRELNTAARSSIAIERRRIACEHYLRLLGVAHTDVRSVPPSTVSVPPTPRGKGRVHASSSDAKVMAGEFYEDIFDGLSVESRTVGDPGAEEMDLA